MNPASLNIALFFGGRSAEHEISIRSARNLSLSLRKIYSVHHIYISKQGEFYYLPLEQNEPFPDTANGRFDPDSMLGPLLLQPGSKQPFYRPDTDTRLEIDVCFPIVHGTYGEDGSIQGLFRMLDLPFVGPDLLGSAVAMDKLAMKYIFQACNIPTAAFRSLHQEQVPTDSEAAADFLTMLYHETSAELGNFLFIKPANMGSSVGVGSADDTESFIQGVEHAFHFDDHILIEKAIRGREIEISVRGNENPEVSLPGEIRSQGFYTYEEKYSTESQTELDVPARLDADTIKAMQDLAIHAYRALFLSGLSRVDFFLEEKQGHGDQRSEAERLLINEVNTLPGFTEISMYPVMFEKSGLEREKLLQDLVQYAMDRQQKLHSLQTDR